MLLGVLAVLSFALATSRFLRKETTADTARTAHRPTGVATPPVATAMREADGSGGSGAARVEVPPVPPQPSPVSAESPTPVPEETWQERYSKFTLGEVIDESRTLRAAIEEISMPYYQERYDRGDYEVLGFRDPDKKFDIPVNDDELSSITFFKEGTVAKVVLPRDEFPEAYEMKEKVDWLNERQSVLERKPLTDFKLNVRR